MLKKCLKIRFGTYFPKFCKVAESTEALIAGSFPMKKIVEKSDIDIFVPITDSDSGVRSILKDENLIATSDVSCPLIDWFFRNFGAAGNECRFYHFDEIYRVRESHLRKEIHRSESRIAMDLDGEINCKVLELAREKSTTDDWSDCPSLALEIFEEAKVWAQQHSDTANNLSQKSDVDTDVVRPNGTIQIVHVKIPNGKIA